MAERTSNELRCFCARKPLLATYGLDEKKELYIHVKVFKQSRIYGEIIAKKGEVKLLCRECLRWHKVVIRIPGTPELEEQSQPPVISEAP